MEGRILAAVAVLVVAGGLIFLAVLDLRTTAGFVGILVCLFDVWATALYFWPEPYRSPRRPRADIAFALVASGVCLGGGIVLALWGLRAILP